MFFVFWLFTDRAGSPQLSKEIGTWIWDMLVQLFQALTRFLTAIISYRRRAWDALALVDRSRHRRPAAPRRSPDDETLVDEVHQHWVSYVKARRSSRSSGWRAGSWCRSPR